MPKPPFAPVTDEAPTANDLTDYDQKHLTTHLRLLRAGPVGLQCRINGIGYHPAFSILQATARP
jgi:hypothetical protein